MRRFLIVIGILFLILAGLTEIVLPQTLNTILKQKIAQLTWSQQVDLSVDSSPRFMIAAGRVDSIHGQVKNGRIGELDTANLTLDAQNVKVNMIPLLFGDKVDENGKHKTVEDYIQSIGNVHMTGIISEENLKNFLKAKVSQLDNLELKITPEAINATSNVTIMGRSADIELSGIIIVDEGDLYFRMTKLNVKNAVLRHVQLDRFFGDVKIVSADKLPIGLKFDTVELKEGQALLTAVRGNNQATR